MGAAGGTLLLFGRAVTAGNSAGDSGLRGFPHFLFDFPLSQKPMFSVPPVRASLNLPDGIGSQTNPVLDIFGHDRLHFIQRMTRGFACRFPAQPP
jgi:hypothetical protein